MPLTNIQRTEISNHYFRSSSSVKPTVWAIALHTADPGVSGTANELSGNGYGRVNLPPSDTNWSAHVNGQFHNLVEVLFNAANGGNWPTATHFSIWDAVAGGTARYTGTLNSPVSISVGQAARFAPSALVVQM